jgi:DNA-binding NarL/FixJ family response regulator
MRCKRVVIADQHPAMLEGMRRMLATETESVLMVSDEASLLQAVEAAAPDLVIVDLSLPVSGAGNVVRLLKQRYRDTPIIVVSVHDDPAAAGEAEAAGAEGFVLKQRVVVDLIPAVREVCEGRRYCSMSG